MKRFSSRNSPSENNRMLCDPVWARAMHRGMGSGLSRSGNALIKAAVRRCPTGVPLLDAVAGQVFFVNINWVMGRWWTIARFEFDAMVKVEEEIAEAPYTTIPFVRFTYFGGRLTRADDVSPVGRREDGTPIFVQPDRILEPWKSLRFKARMGMLTVAEDDVKGLIEQLNRATWDPDLPASPGRKR